MADNKLSEGLGYIAQTFPIQFTTTVGLMAGGSLLAGLISLRKGEKVTNGHAWITTAGASLTLSKIGLYSTAGVLLASTADLGTSWQSTGLKTHVFTTPYTALEDAVFYIALLATGGTLPQTNRLNSPLAFVALSEKPFPVATQASLTDLPDPATLVAGQLLRWAAVS